MSRDSLQTSTFYIYLFQRYSFRCDIDVAMIFRETRMFPKKKKIIHIRDGLLLNVLIKSIESHVSLKLLLLLKEI